MKLAKKGFTLIELIIGLGIIGTITGISVPVYNNITSQVKENNLSNKIKNIETAGEKYAFDTGNEIFLVEDLVKNGYIKSDNNNEEIINPVDNSIMNCYVIKAERNNNYYKAEYLKEENTLENNKCNISNYYYKNNLVNIYINGNINDNEWYRGNIILTAVIPGITIDCKKNKCEWTSSSGINEKESFLNLSIDGVRNNAEYVFRYITDNNYYIGSEKISIDNEAPNVSLEINNEEEHILSKKIVIKANDGNGSGIDKYSLSSSNECSVDYKEDSFFQVTENGTYLICVKDKVGNVTKIEKEVKDIANVIIFDANGGVVNPNSKLVIQGNIYGELPIPTRTGYTFNGWYTSTSGGNEITSGSIVNGNQTVYAQWTANNYTLTYNNQSGSGCSSKTGTYGSTWGTLCTPTRTGYTFNGWYTSISGGNEITSSSLVNGNQTVYAQWTINYTCYGGTLTYDSVKGQSSGGYVCLVNGEYYEYQYSYNCSKCEGCSSSTKTCDTCGGECKWLAIPWCTSWNLGNVCALAATSSGLNCKCVEYSYCNGECRECDEYYDTYECNCTTVCTKTYTYSCNCDTGWTYGYACPSGYQEYSGSGSSLKCYKNATLG